MQLAQPHTTVVLAACALLVVRERAFELINLPLIMAKQVLAGVHIDTLQEGACD